MNICEALQKRCHAENDKKLNKEIIRAIMFPKQSWSITLWSNNNIFDST